MPTTWFITGAGRGLGRAIASAALERGDFVAACSRRRPDVLDPAGWFRSQDSTFATAPPRGPRLLQHASDSAASMCSSTMRHAASRRLSKK